MLKPAGTRLRMLLAAVMEAVTRSSAMVMVAAGVSGPPTVKLRLAAEETVCASSGAEA